MDFEFEMQTSSDGNTFWLNTATSCIGRFSKKFGMDIHTPLEDQMQGKPQCLHCTHTEAGREDWLEFCRLIRLHFKIVVPLDMMEFEE